MALRYWKIPSSSLGKKRFEFFFFALGFGGNFPIPSSHIQAINIVLDWKINKICEKEGIGQCPLFQKRALINCIRLKNKQKLWKRGYWPIPCFWKIGYWSIPCFWEKGYWPIPCFHRRYWEMYWYMDISVLFFNIIQWIFPLSECYLS